MQGINTVQSLELQPASIPRTLRPVMNMLWVLVVVLSVGLFLLGWPLRLQELLSPPGEIAVGLQEAGLSSALWAAGMLGSETILMLCVTILGVSLYTQRRKEVVIFVTSLLLITFGTGILNVLDAFIVGYPQLEPIVRLQKVILWSLLLLFFYIFPNGKFDPGWSRWSYAGWLLFNWSWFVLPESHHNPMRFDVFTDDWVFLIYFTWLISGAGVMYHRSQNLSSAVARQQTKWVMAGFVAAVFIALIEELPSMLDHGLMDHTTPEGVVYALISTIIFTLGVLLGPLGIAFSIRQERLWQIDYLINRGLVYAVLSLLIVLGLYGVFYLLTALFRSYISLEFYWLTVVSAAAAMALLFIPLKRWIQTQVDRKIFGIQINYQKKNRVASHGQNTTIDWTNSKIGRYQIGKYLHGGKFGGVYYGTDSDSGKPVAVKFLHAHLAEIDQSRKAFVSEAKILSSLDHPNIINFLDYGEDSQNTCYIVMEYLDAITLAEKLKQEHQVGLEETKYILSRLASALDYAHHKGVYHLDLKPSNILLKTDPRASYGYIPVLTDFGISRMMDQKQPMIYSGVSGTFEYISPEQIINPNHLDGKADIYALGVMAYRMLTGKLPFSSEHVAALLIAHINQPPPNPLVYEPDLPVKTAFAILNALEKEPSQRCENASLFMERFA